MTDTLAALLREQGWEPESNICRCGHKGGDHDLNNRCLVCLPLGSDYFASFSKAELWANAAARLAVTLAPPEYGGALYTERFTNSDHNSAPQPDTASRELREALNLAVRDVLDKAEADDDFDGQFIDYLVPHDAIAALRAAYAPWASPDALAATEGE